MESLQRRDQSAGICAPPTIQREITMATATVAPYRTECSAGCEVDCTEYVQLMRVALVISNGATLIRKRQALSYTVQHPWKAELLSPLIRASRLLEHRRRDLRSCSG